MKNTRRHPFWWFLPILLALPAAAAIVYLWIRYGQTVSDLALSALKLVVKP